jgi:hypothetical protein
MLKTLIIYVHLLAACVAIGTLVIQDLSLAKTKGNSLSRIAIKELTRAADIMFVALILLWLSGLALVSIGYIDSADYLTNQKLWAKFSVVSILTLNGIALHFYSFPRVTSHKGLLGLTTSEQILVVATGALSSISWLFACYLGIARPWNFTVDYSFIMIIYSGLLVIAFVAAGEVLRGMRKADVDSSIINNGLHMQSSRKFD